MIASEAGKTADTSCLLDSEPQQVAEQEQQMIALAEMLYAIFTQHQPQIRSAEPQPFKTISATPKTFTGASTAIN